LDTDAVCAIDIFGEAAKKGILPFPVAKLFQEMFFCSLLARKKLHLDHGFQEEELNLSEISEKDQWTFRKITEVLHAPLMEALKKVLISKENFSENCTWNFILRGIFSSVWIHYCIKREVANKISRSKKTQITF
jgi:hypothetical protein